MINLPLFLLFTQTALPVAPTLPPTIGTPTIAVTTPTVTTPTVATSTVTTPTVIKGLQLSPADRTAAKIAWKYFEHNWDQKTGLVHSVDRLPWTTIWDQGSALLGIHSARQLGLITPKRFQERIKTTLTTLETLPLEPSGLPHKAYDTKTTQMLDLSMQPDPTGSSGYSALDIARLLGALHILRYHYPELKPQIERIVDRWKLQQLVQPDGQIYGLSRLSQGQLQRVQEGRSGYEQYAAHLLQLWNIQASTALNNPSIDRKDIDGVLLDIDRRNLHNSGASNYLTNDPYVLLALEVGIPIPMKTQVDHLLLVQEKRFQKTGILTAVNEDSLDRFPYFLYYNVSANGEDWQPITSKGKAYPQFRFLSTKAAFAWSSLKPNHPYTQALQKAVQTLRDPDRGYYSGRYENANQGVNQAINVNTNAIILESLLYRSRQGKPLSQ